ncbi:MAG: zf-HC2 domain-containing protein [Armatimonadota bacterium]
MSRGHLSEVELTEYADGELAGQHLGGAEAHLQSCPLCSALLSRVRQSAVAVGSIASRAVPAEVRGRARSVLGDASLSISCREAKAMIQERLDRRLSLFAAVPLEVHLSRCQACRSELAALSRATRAVRAVATVQSPGQVRERVLAARRAETRRAIGAPRWRPAVAVAFAALAVGAVTLLRPRAADVTGRPVAPAVQARAGLPPRAVDVAAAVPVPSVEEARAEATVEAAQPAAIAPVTLRQDRFSRHTVSLPAKGPAPGIAAPSGGSPGVVLPAALRALRAVAQSASPDWEAQRAMESAGERFATLNSEAASQAMLAALPITPESSPGGAGEAARDTLPSGAGDAGRAQDNSGGQSNQPSAPVREGASLDVGPFV